MKTCFYFATLFSCVTFLSACGGGSDDPPFTECDEKKQALTSGGSQTWVLTSIETPINTAFGQVEIDLLSETILSLAGSPAEIVCLKDNTITFNINGNLGASEGADVCEGLPEEGSGNWSLSSGCDSIYVSSSDSLLLLQNSAIPFEVSSSALTSNLTIDIDTTFEFSFSGSKISIGPEVTTKVTLKKQ